MKFLVRSVWMLFLCHAVCAAFGQAGINRILPSDQFMDPSQVKLGGILGKAVLSSENGRLMTLPHWHNGELIQMFTDASRSQNSTTDWYGEHAGKWLYATAMAADRSDNQELKKLLLETADFLISNQSADGYLGSYSAALRITSTSSTRHNRSWDTWTLSYMILGLLKVNAFYPNDKYLNAAKGIGELLLRTFGNGDNDITLYGTRYGISATICLDPVVELYKVTGDKRYLDFALLIVKEMEARKGLQLLSAGMAGRDMETVADGKAYQIIWNLLGLAKLYEVTGTAGYLKAVENAWENIRDYHLTLAGGPWGGIGKHKECFNSKGFWNPYGFVETCSTMSWIQLNKFLLYLTANCRYASELEKSTYNALLGAQFPNGEDWCYHSFSNGRRHIANFNDCCPSSGALALEEISPLVYSTRKSGIAVNLYTPCEATVSLDGNYQVAISQRTNYPFDGKVAIEISTPGKKTFPVFIRIPDWAGEAKLTINGDPFPGSIPRGQYLEINRVWDGRSTITLFFNMPIRIIEKPEFATAPQSKADIYRVKWFAVARGPLLYACHGLIGGKDRERNLDVNIREATALFKTVSSDKDDGETLELRLPGSAAMKFLPYYRADNRQVDTWRLTWIQYGIQ